MTPCPERFKTQHDLCDSGVSAADRMSVAPISHTTEYLQGEARQQGRHIEIDAIVANVEGANL